MNRSVAPSTVHSPSDTSHRWSIHVCFSRPMSRERMELLAEVRFYQLGSMESWMRSQTTVLSPHGSPGFSMAGVPPARPTVAHTGSPGRRVLYQPAPHSPAPPPRAAAAVTATTPGTMRTPHPIRAAFMEAAAASPAPGGGPAYSIPCSSAVVQAPPYAHKHAATHAPTGGEQTAGASAAPSKWTSKYLVSNDGLRDAANTLMELAFIGPHRSLHAGKLAFIGPHRSLYAGKVSLRISAGACRHERPSSLLAGAPSGEAARGRPELVAVRSTAGWSFDLALKPGSTEEELFNKYHISEFVQDNWFVLGAVLKDQFGVVMEEDTGVRPACAACRRCTLAVTLTKVF
ncbi:hypothetical protein FOA52_005747 [Chlamydomonas sp. UWO 241]|nr:hypothetical protein FOA52_005747 [Chlamydomonas sp. UWO 241]